MTPADQVANVGTEVRCARPRTIIPAHRVISLLTPFDVGDTDQRDTQVEVRREGAGVAAVHVYCRCGERIVLECELSSGRDVQ